MFYFFFLIYFGNDSLYFSSDQSWSPILDLDHFYDKQFPKEIDAQEQS